MLVDDFEDPASQGVVLEQVAEVEDGRLVGDGLAEREEAEGSHRLGLVEEVLRAGVAEVVAELHGVDAQHHGEGVGPPPAAGLGVVGLDGCFVLLPRHEAIRPFEELLAAHRVAVLRELDSGECRLMHGTLPFPVGCHDLIMIIRVCKCESRAKIPHLRRRGPREAVSGAGSAQHRGDCRRCESRVG